MRTDTESEWQRVERIMRAGAERVNAAIARRQRRRVRSRMAIDAILDRWADDGGAL